MKKHFTIFITTFLIALSMCMTVFASNIEINDATEKSKAPRYEANCQGSADGKHYMHANGYAWVRDTSGNPLFTGYCYQCSGCYLVLGTESDPWTTHTVGRYASYMPYESLSGVGAVIETNYLDSFYGDIRTDSYWKGFLFIKGNH